MSAAFWTPPTTVLSSKGDGRCRGHHFVVSSAVSDPVLDALRRFLS